MFVLDVCVCVRGGVGVDVGVCQGGVGVCVGELVCG